MTSRDQFLLQIYRQWLTRDLDRHLNDFNALIEILNELQDTIFIAKSILKPWQGNFEIQVAKFAIQCGSIAQLATGTKIKARKKEVIVYDLASIYVLSRSIIENYLIINYLNHSPKSEEQGEFRNDLYALSGLSRRQEFDIKIEEGNKKKAKEKKDIDELIGKIRKNKYFKSLAPTKQKKLLADRPSKEIGWEQLLKPARIQNREYLLMWKLYSNYAHSEYISSMQLTDYLRESALMKDAVFTSMVQNIITISILISDIVDNFISARIKFNMLTEELRTKVEFWGVLGRSKQNAPQQNVSDMPG